MAIFKCKMCGGDLSVVEGVTVAECEYCGTKQTLPSTMDENLQTLYNRANTLRIKNDFDKAEKIYEKIIEAQPNQSEPYWCLILCKYGIEYVDDPITYKKIPTCHRASYDSIIADEDYKSALKYANAEQKVIYEQQAREIDRIQKEILTLAQKEEKYDVFICYKETDESGKRTQDSVIANDIYYQLTAQGFKVFYAAITLEGKLGSAYEPIIFAALNSAKVMLVIGTKPEYFNAIWVKNEWARYLKILKKDRTKLLIPCYKDMDAYELPDEFAHLQAQDMGKIGFITDVIRGVNKVLGNEKPMQTPKPTYTPVEHASGNVAAILKRGFMALEDGDWNKADDFFEQALNYDAELAEAYLGKLMIDLHVKSKSGLNNCSEPFEDNNNYLRVLRFGDEKIVNEVKDYNNAIVERLENERKDAIYKKALFSLSYAKSAEDYRAAAEMFESIKGYKDSEIKASEARENAKNFNKEIFYRSAKEQMESAKDSDAYIDVSELFAIIKGYKDSDALYQECLDKAEQIQNDAIYKSAIALMVGNKVSNYKKAIAEFEKIPGWKDADKKIELCNKRIEEIHAGILVAASEKKNRADARKEAFHKKLPLIKKISLIVVPVLIIGIVAATVLPKINWSALVPKDDTSSSVSSDTTTTSSTVISSEPSTESSEPSNSSTPSSSTTTSSKPSASNTTSTEPDVPTSGTINGLSYTTKNDGTIEITKYIGTSNSVTIPSEIEGRAVTSIGIDAFSHCTGLTSITIPNSVTSIGDWAFYGCAGLTSITIPNSVTSIGEGVFFNCTGLTSITIPNSVTKIGVSAFYGCIGLTSITIPDSVTSIGVEAFSGCTGLTSITIPDSVTSIGGDAFSHCSGLTSITIPNGVTSIGNYAFIGCTGLTSITIPNSVTSIGYSAFNGCFGLTSITIPNSVTSIGDNAFYHCTSLKEINFTGTKAQWNNLVKNKVLGLNSDVTIHCTDGDITLTY